MPRGAARDVIKWAWSKFRARFARGILQPPHCQNPAYATVRNKKISVCHIYLYSIILILSYFCICFVSSVSLTSVSDKLLVDVRVGFSFALAGSDRVDIYVGASRRTDQQDNIPTSADMQSNIDVRMLNNMMYVLCSRKVNIF